MFPKVTLIVGGAASGKSSWAEGFVNASGKPKTYLATARILDREMQTKVDLHKARRDDGWTLIEAHTALAPALSNLEPGHVCLIDCATMWLSNHLQSGNDLLAAQSALLTALTECNADLVIVSNEVGQGIVPDNPDARAFREAQGRLNITLAARADLVVQVSLGLPQVLKGQLP